MVRGRIYLAPPTAHASVVLARSYRTRMKFKSSHRSLIVYLIIATALQLSYEAECKHQYVGVALSTLHCPGQSWPSNIEVGKIFT